MRSDCDCYKVGRYPSFTSSGSFHGQGAGFCKLHDRFCRNTLEITGCLSQVISSKTSGAVSMMTSKYVQADQGSQKINPIGATNPNADTCHVHAMIITPHERNQLGDVGPGSSLSPALSFLLSLSPRLSFLLSLSLPLSFLLSLFSPLSSLLSAVFSPLSPPLASLLSSIS